MWHDIMLQIWHLSPYLFTQLRLQPRGMITACGMTSCNRSSAFPHLPFHMIRIHNVLHDCSIWRISMWHDSMWRKHIWYVMTACNMTVWNLGALPQLRFHTIRIHTTWHDCSIMVLWRGGIPQCETKAWQHLDIIKQEAASSSYLFMQCNFNSRLTAWRRYLVKDRGMKACDMAACGMTACGMAACGTQHGGIKAVKDRGMIAIGWQHEAWQHVAKQPVA